MYKILDLFSGAGGFSAGLDKLPQFNTLLALDINDYALETFKKNFPSVTTIAGDITNSEVKKNIIKLAKEKEINMVIGGPPCQGFSNKGKKMGLNDPRNYLFIEFLDIVNKLNPELVIIENVKSMINAADGYFMNEITERIENLGYFMSCSVLNSSKFSVPQVRERAFIIAYKNKTLTLPDQNSNNILTVRDAISDLSYLDSGEGEGKTNYINQAFTEYQKEMRKNSEFLYNHVASKHSELALKKLSYIPPEKGKEYLPKELIGKQKFNTTWSRLIWDKPSPTIDTRFDTPSNGRNSHPYLNRSITAREAARLQSFPDNFQFLGTKTEICKQIGNAVPPKLSYAIGKDLIKQINQNDRIKTKNIKIYNGDSYDLFNELSSDGLVVDHIITDPPYNISKTNNFSTMRNPRKGIDFGEWDKDFNLYSWIAPYSSILKKGGSIIIFCSYRYISYFIDELEKNNLIVKDVLKWEKTNPMPRNVNRRYVQDTEFAIWAVKKGEKWTFNKPDNISYLRSKYETSTVSGKERTSHPTQKSVKLMKEIINIHTNSDDVILDLFMGSGTTGVASVELNRKFVGIEIDKDYFDLSRRRLIDNK
ncbi:MULTISPECIES: DNA (cytosine-5-)-methyltransferase [Staphylococcus]|uniref:DNA (cytosine-5-)-methyltransferase n=1 Tax=Staphylococcus cohnii subsp. cohnii TaxID=74704 RepID=A0A0M2NS90_STACC|nr:MULTISPECIES: DNA (cytosine-5-)-methyltransferase [Staphylococcus]KKI62576.1 Adenine-specific methyltransferase [Staphylococcus cohnii subsp. cohnii]